MKKLPQDVIYPHVIFEVRLNIMHDNYVVWWDNPLLVLANTSYLLRKSRQCKHFNMSLQIQLLNNSWKRLYQRVGSWSLSISLLFLYVIQVAEESPLWSMEPSMRNTQNPILNPMSFKAFCSHWCIRTVMGVLSKRQLFSLNDSRCINDEQFIICITCVLQCKVSVMLTYTEVAASI